MNWKEFLTKTQADKLFSASFLERWGQEAWNPSQDDRTASVLLHIQLHSRVAMQPLGYLDGVESSALKSVYELFGETRDICNRFPAARQFDVIAWEVLNTWVRPFTAKWHRESQRATLSALDGTDEFRAGLGALQNVLRRFDGLLLKTSDETQPLPSDPSPSDREKRITEEMKQQVLFGIDTNYSGIPGEQALAINETERRSIQKRRDKYQVRQEAPDAVGLAISGGGIRSATFSLGVLVALAERDLLPQVDYLSTVSGGGYVGSFLSAFLSSEKCDGIGLRSTELPFLRRSGEAQALRHIRHRCKYLSTGSAWQRRTMVFAQVYGMLLNGIALALYVALAVVMEQLLRATLPEGTLGFFTRVALMLLLLSGVFSFLTLRRRNWQRYSDLAMAVSTVTVLLLLCVDLLAPVRGWYAAPGASTFFHWSRPEWLTVAGAIPVIASALAVMLSRFRKFAITALLILTGISAPIFVFGVYLELYDVFGNASFAPAHPWVPFVVVIAMFLAYLFFFDVNSTSPHRHYRDRLSETFLIRPVHSQNGNSGKADQPERPRRINKDAAFDAGITIKLSKLTENDRSPYHLINCALNVPGSKNIALQGRLTDFFLFTPGFSGSSLTGYTDTREWEAADSNLDLGTAMAISAAAAAPQMGLGTIKSLSFWMALLNIRLGYWAKRPGSKLPKLLGGPGLFCLLKEMLGIMNENSTWLNLSDGGHIENLGVYELLRRRCKYIIVIDGEHDENMTFHALTTLQRLAAIDFGVRIDINLDDLRLNDQHLSRSHFRFCRIRYPKAGRGSPDEYGYLLYVKLSLTGNEGEFIRRYRIDNPSFPHDTTANQFFTETQFEAYRSLGEHVGNKLFLRAIVGDMADADHVNLEDWFLRLGKALLEPIQAQENAPLPDEGFPGA